MVCSFCLRGIDFSFERDFIILFYTFHLPAYFIIVLKTFKIIIFMRLKSHNNSFIQEN